MAESGFRLPLHVEEHGSGRPVILVHGFGGNSYTWRRWIPRLAREFRVVVVDLKGHGSAPKPDDDAYGPLDQAELLVRMVRARNLRDATLVGHSLGGGIAAAATLQLLEGNPDVLRSLVLISAAVLPQDIPPYISMVRRPLLGAILLRLIPVRTLIRRALRSIVFDPSTVSVDQVEAYAQPFESPEGRRALRNGARSILPDDPDHLSARLPELDLPTLLLWGGADPVVPVEQARRLHSMLPRSRLVVLDECGHLPQEERAGESLDEVLSFLAEAESPPGQADGT